MAILCALVYLYPVVVKTDIKLMHHVHIDIVLWATVCALRFQGLLQLTRLGLP